MKTLKKFLAHAIGQDMKENGRRKSAFPDNFYFWLALPFQLSKSIDSLHFWKLLMQCIVQLSSYFSKIICIFFIRYLSKFKHVSHLLFYVNRCSFFSLNKTICIHQNVSCKCDLPQFIAASDFSRSIFDV